MNNNFMMSGNKSSNGNFEENLALLTVVIPTYQRQQYLLRVCKYWQNTAVKLIIVDGSEESFENQLSQTLNNFPNIKYFHLPEKFNLRLNFSTNFINTPYTVLSADDEFLTYSGLSSAIRTLKSNADVVACGGQTIKFNPFRTTKKIDYGEGYKTFGYNVTQNSISERLNFAFKDYKPATFYAVMKSDVWKKSWGNMVTSNFAMVLEFEQVFTTYICGKLLTIDEVVRLWSVEELPVVDPKLDRIIKFEDWWENEIFNNEKDMFLLKLTNEICGQFDIEPNEARKIILVAVNNYLDKPLNWKPWPKNPLMKLKKLFKDLLLLLLPIQIIYILKLLRNYMLSLVINRVNYLWPKLKYGTLDSMIKNQNKLPFTLTLNLIKDLKTIEEVINLHYGKN
jgi:glycosyltransferase domain-containing protein